MSRRPIELPLADGISAIRRMAPGGRLWSESRILPFFRPVGEAGTPDEATTEVAPKVISAKQKARP